MYYDHVKFFFNTPPSDILKDELDRSLGIGEEETLIEYMTKCDPAIIEALKSIESSGRKEGAVGGSTLEKYKEKKADNPLNKQGLSAFSGGGEPRLKMVMNGAEFEESDRSILSEFLTTLPRTAVHVPNPTFKVSVIGRRMLTYCSTFGAEE